MLCTKSTPLQLFFVYVRRMFCKSGFCSVDLEPKRRYPIYDVGIRLKVTFHAIIIGNYRTLLRQSLDEENDDHKTSNSDS